MGNIKIISDGTIAKTFIVDANTGEKLGCVTNMKITADPKKDKFLNIELTAMFVGLDIELSEQTVEFLNMSNPTTVKIRDIEVNDLELRDEFCHNCVDFKVGCAGFPLRTCKSIGKDPLETIERSENSPVIPTTKEE